MVGITGIGIDTPQLKPLKFKRINLVSQEQIFPLPAAIQVGTGNSPKTGFPASNNSACLRRLRVIERFPEQPIKF
jgi:hypothetical protein